MAEADHLMCGLAGIRGHGEASVMTALMLQALQHRGQEAAGIVSFDIDDADDPFKPFRSLGLVADIFGEHRRSLQRIPGRSAIGHVRYSTQGDSILQNVQPLLAEMPFGGLALAHNGNITNARTLRRALVQKGALFQTSTDTEVIMHLVARSSGSTVAAKLAEALLQIEGAYSLIAMTREHMIGIRDPLGFWPLSLGTVDGAYVLASEPCAFDLLGATHLRDVAPGQMVFVNEAGFTTTQFAEAPRRAKCLFEYAYFARPDNVIADQSVYEVRKRMGAALARECAGLFEADVVVPVLDSGLVAAIGYSQESGTPFELGLIRNHYVGRTFIEPSDGLRHFGVRLKHNANRAAVAGKRVVLVDDSVVRGTTSTKIVQMVRGAGATEVYLASTWPPVTHSCPYGIDTPEDSELLAFREHGNIDAMARAIGVDGLHFLSEPCVESAAKCQDYCNACVTGDYPTPLTDRANCLC